MTSSFASRWLLTCLAGFVIVGCTSPKGDNPDEKRQAILDESQQTLSMLSDDKNITEQEVKDAYGYATMSNIATQVLLVGGGNGYGVAVNNESGEQTFMKSSTIEGGPGVGVASYRSVLVFETEEVFNDFITGKWLMEAETDAVAKTRDGSGGSAETNASFDKDVEIYNIGEDGLQVKVDLSGISFEPYNELN